jgi:TolA-binding protein
VQPPYQPLAAATGESVGENQKESMKTAALTARREWLDLHAQARYEEALASADREGFDGLIQTLDLDDLWKLSDTARMARKSVKASKALAAVRKRFAGSPRARTAAYFLGKVTMDLEGDPAGASRWFELYCREDPEGRLSEEALGWLIDARSKSGQKDAAKDAARRYLQKHPDGTFTDLARSVLGE